MTYETRKPRITAEHETPEIRNLCGQIVPGVRVSVEYELGKEFEALKELDHAVYSVAEQIRQTQK